MMQEAAPVVAGNPWLNPTFLLGVGTTLVILIWWFLRGEFQSKANTTRQKEHEEHDDRRHGEIFEYVDEITLANALKNRR